MRTLLITGASSGIGRATALHAGRTRDYRIAVHYRSQRAEAERVVAALADTGTEAVAIAADLGDEAQIVALYDAVERALGPVDAVVNSAGVVAPKSKVGALQADALRTLLSVNVLGVMLSCREAARRMAGAGNGGVIINVSSMAATIGGRPGSAAYAASKAAVDAFTVGLAKEVAADGIRAVSLRPGMVDTEMTRDALADPAFAAAVQRSIPLGRAARPEEVAAPIVWLLSPEASFVSGACIDVSGGGFHIAG
ncbi:MAG: SDR family oxidoreductase [Polyangiales bacterium]